MTCFNAEIKGSIIASVNRQHPTPIDQQLRNFGLWRRFGDKDDIGLTDSGALTRQRSGGVASAGSGDDWNAQLTGAGDRNG